jgi:proline iminopeptidase
VFLFAGCGKQGEQPETTEIKTEVSSGTITVDDFKLHYIVEGEGIPCMVVGSHIFWPRTFSKELRNHLRLVFADCRFFAPSDEEIDISKLSIDTFVDDVEQVRKALGIERMAVLGHSALGVLALEYGKKYPEHTSHVIMIGTPPNVNEEYQKLVDEFWESDASDERKTIWENRRRELTDEYLSKVSPFEAWSLRYINSSPWYWFNPEYDCSWLWEGLDGNMELIDYFFETLLNEYEASKGLDQLNLPVFIAMGRYDYAVPYHSWDNVKDKFQNLSYPVFEKSGHYPMLEEWELFDKKFLDWIKSN